MTDELGPAIGYMDKPKPPRVMKQPTKDELRRELDRARLQLMAANEMYEQLLAERRPAWWRRLFNLTKEPK